MDDGGIEFRADHDLFERGRTLLRFMGFANDRYRMSSKLAEGLSIYQKLDSRSLDQPAKRGDV